MANALVDLIKTGDKDALNAYLLNQQVSGDSSGMSINNQPNNALTAIVRGQSQPRMQAQAQPMNTIVNDQTGQYVKPQQPVNTIINDQTGRYVGPQGNESENIQQFQSSKPIALSNGKIGYLNNRGNVTFHSDQGQLVSIPYSQIQATTAEKQRRQEMQNLYGQAQEHQLKVMAGLAPKESTPVFNPTAGGYIYPPTPENPQGKFVPIAGLPAAMGGKAPTEDQAKAAGWFNQAQNAYENLTRSMTDPATGQVSYKAATPSAIEGLLPAGMKGAVQSPERQRFMQASSSMSEALLRAATGAGVNKEEAAQKINELTPTYWDDESTKKQKLDAIPVYLRSLQTRAGRASVINPSIQPLNLPGKAGGLTGGNSVTAPDGSVHNFPNAAAADAFRKAIGM